MASSSELESLTSTMESWSRSGNPQAAFADQLAEFPHTFQRQNLWEVRATQLEQVKSGLESALLVGYKTNTETARARNLLAYILFELHQPDDALKELDLVLDMEDQTTNVVTLANRAVILCRQSEFSKARYQLTRLRQIQAEDSDFEYLLIKAQAEIAFSYTRFGPQFAPDARNLFEEAIPMAREPERWLWKFGLGLTRRRALRSNPRVIFTAPSEDFADENRSILQIFLEIVENCTCSNLKAKTYAEIANVLFSVSKTPLRREFFDMARMSTTKACEKALELDSDDKSVLCKCGIILRRCQQEDSDDKSVLCKCGIILRRCQQVERARALLEKSLRLRVSTTAHHHLGLTYKLLATREKQKDQVETPEYYQELAEQQSQRGACQSIDDITWQFKNLSAGGTQHHQCDAADTATGFTRITEGPPLSLNRDTRAMQKMIKSPPGNVAKFSRDDKYVKEALHHLDKAVEVSNGENVRAIYDLALMQRSLEEFKAARDTLMLMLNMPDSNKFPFDHVNAYEQMGQILMELGERESNRSEKDYLHQRSKSMLLTALKEACQALKRAGVAEHPGEVFSSFAILFKKTEETTDVVAEIEEKVKLLKLIEKYRPVLGLLQELEKLDPQKANEPTHQAMMIESYANLGDFVEAAFLMEALTDTAKVTEMCGDEQYRLKIYMKAARQSLFSGLPATSHFRSAFHEFLLLHPEEASSSEFDDSDSSGSARNQPDVFIVNEISVRSQAQTLVRLLKSVCGLDVRVADERTPRQVFELDGLETAGNSKLAVIVAGGEPSDLTRFYIHRVAKRSTTVTLLVRGDQVPTLLQAKRFLPCDDSLFQHLSSAASGKLRESEIEAVFKILHFLFNIRETIEF